METDWARMARPQEDAYDTDQLHRFARARWGYGGKYTGGPRFLNLELVAANQIGEHVEDAPLDDPRLMIVADLLRTPIFADALDLLDHFAPMLHKGDYGRGCTSGHDKPSTGSRMGCYVTINDPTGCAEGIVHELAHQRLHCMGIDLDVHDGTLFTNDNVERWFSPIRRDKLRPMCALVHGVYAYMWVLALDMHAKDGVHYLKQNVPKVRRGLQEIAKGVTPTDAGKAFFSALFEWGADLVAMGEDRLALNGALEVMWEGGISG